MVVAVVVLVGVLVVEELVGVLVVEELVEMTSTLQNTGIVGSTTGSNYYVRILSTIDR